MGNVKPKPLDYESRPPIRVKRLIGPILNRIGFFLTLTILAALLLFFAGLIVFVILRG
jgi:hypothetical protein